MKVSRSKMYFKSSDRRVKKHARQSASEIYLQSHCDQGCDGCSQKFSVQRVLERKKGGSVISRHNEIRDELADLADKAIILSAVRNEP
jgi:stress-induced morphogen